MKAKEIFSIPNMITYLRLCLMPLYVYLSITASTPVQYRNAAILLFIMAFTDFLDGFIARTCDMITELGKFMDPVADKFFQLAIAVSLVNRIDGMWIVFIVFMVKESVLGFLSMHYYARYKRKMDGAMWCGKVSTVIFYATTFLMVFLPPLDSTYYYVMESIMIVGLMIAFVRYGIFYYNMHLEVKRNK